MHHFGADWKVSTPLCRRSCSQDDRSQWLSLTYPLVSQHSVTFLVLFQKSLHQSIYLWVNDLWEKKNQIGSYTDTVIAVSQNCSKNVITEITLKNNVVILVKVCTRRACCVTSGGCDVLWLVGWGISVAPHLLHLWVCCHDIVSTYQKNCSSCDVDIEPCTSSQHIDHHHHHRVKATLFPVLGLQADKGKLMTLTPASAVL